MRRTGLLLLSVPVLLGYLLGFSPRTWATQGTCLPFPESRFVTVRNFQLHARIFAPSFPRGKKVLFVHGLGGSTFSFRYAPQYLLPEGLFLVMVDLPGFGESSRKGSELSQKAQARLLWECVDVLEEEGVVPEALRGTPWFLVGHSMGGGVVFLMSMEYPERVEGAVLIAPSFGQGDARFLGPLLAFPCVRGVLATALRRAFLSSGKVRKSLASAYGREPEEEEFLGYFTPLKRRGTASSLLAFLSASSRIRLSAFSGREHPPFLVVLGEKEPWVAEDTVRFLRVFPDARYVVIPEAHHCPMETHPESVYPAILDFFSSCVVQ